MYFDMGTAGLSGQLALGKLAKPLPIWSGWKEMSKLFSGLSSLSVYELTLISVCKEHQLQLSAPACLQPKTVSLQRPPTKTS